MSTIGAISGVTGSNKTAFLRINNRHAMFDTKLNYSIAAYQKEFVGKIAEIDFERRELKNFLKRLYHCESDNDPFARKYLKKYNEKSKLLMLSVIARGESETLPEIEEVLRAQVIEQLKKNTELPALACCQNQKNSKGESSKQVGKKVIKRRKAKLDSRLPVVYEDVSLESASAVITSEKAADTLQMRTELKVGTKGTTGPEKALYNGKSKTNENTSSRRASLAQKEFSTEDPLLRFLPGREKVKPTKMDIQVKLFCEKMDQFMKCQTKERTAADIAETL